MQNYSLKQIKEKVLKWSQNNLTSLLKNSDFFEVNKNEKDMLVIDLTFKYCLAQILVSDSTFAPYKYVSFEAMTLDSKKALEHGQPELIYFFYDSIGMMESLKNG